VSDASDLSQALARASVVDHVYSFDDIAAAYAQACDKAVENDRIVVFGSFYTVAAVMAARQQKRLAR
jgi:dihydrofolate synthase/folylpolyglutamate synthase